MATIRIFAMKSRVSYSIDVNILNRFNLVSQRMAWPSNSLVIENAMTQIIEQYDTKGIKEVNCIKCGCKFFNTIWEKVGLNDKKNKCPSCGTLVLKAQVSTQRLQKVQGTTQLPNKDMTTKPVREIKQ